MKGKTMKNRTSLSFAACVLGACLATAAPAAEPVGTKATQKPKTMSLVTLLGPGEFQVVSAGPEWVEIKNLRSGKVARLRMGAGEFETGRRIKITKDTFQNAGGTGSDLNCGPCTKECTTVSTGSSPGPEDDTVSCVCISPDGRACK